MRVWTFFGWKLAVLSIVSLSVCMVPAETVAQDQAVLETQIFLSEHGFNPGRPDGFWGPQTQRALRAFQGAHSLVVSGEMDAQTLEVMRALLEQETRIDRQSGTEVMSKGPDEPAQINTDSFAGIPLLGPQPRPVIRRNPTNLSGGHPQADPVVVPTLAPKFIMPTRKKSGSGAGFWLGLGVVSLFWVWHRRRHYNKVEPKEKTPSPPPRVAVSLRPDQRVLPPAPKKPPAQLPRRAIRTGWMEKGQQVTIAQRTIGGMVYVGAAPRAARYGQTCKAYINPSLSVARVGDDYDGYGMPYWPSYAGIDARSRATYLAWLAGGRSDPRYNPGYVFLYFYGLERRFFVDNPTAQDRSDILAEAKRLLQAYGNNNSVRRYMSAFVEAANILVCAEADWQPIYENAGYELPLSLKVAIGARLVAGKPLTADWMLSWLLCDPETRLRTPAIRCRPEFMALFRQLFAQKYPAGMKVRTPKRVLAPNYDAASGEFSVGLQISDTHKSLPDISGSRKPVNDARVIAEAAMDQLDKFSRYLGRTPDGRGTIEAYALLPASLWPLFPCTEVDALKAWVAGIIQRGRLVPLIELIERLEKSRPQKATKKRIIGAADALARLGVGMAPDPRYALRSPKYDEPVVLFSLAEGHIELEMVSDAYRVALANLALATIIAQADGMVVEAEQAALVLFVRTAEGLTAPERMRLAANLKWFLAVPQNMSVLRARINAATAAQKQAFKQAALAMAHADRVVRPEEVGKIERLYKALGFDPKTIYSDLHGFSPPDAPVTMQAATMGAPGEPIPPEGAALDHGRIKEIMADTSRVAAVLGDIFSDEEEEEEDTAPTPRLLEGLPAKYQTFVAELIMRDHWPETDFDSLVIRYKLMASGCLEVVNEWAFAAFDDALIDEYDGYDISPDIAAAIKAEAEQER